ncbi:hypothetical protein Tco_0669682, partial [Tanacetum coccineum]
RGTVGGVALGVVSVSVPVSVISGSLLPVVERVGLGGLGAWIGVVSEVVCGTSVVLCGYGSSRGTAVACGLSVSRFWVSGGCKMSLGCSIGILMVVLVVQVGCLGKRCPKQSRVFLTYSLSQSGIEKYGQFLRVVLDPRVDGRGFCLISRLIVRALPLLVELAWSLKHLLKL